jgi:ribosomal protein S18 acetylase RimI-like enzyme
VAPAPRVTPTVRAVVLVTGSTERWRAVDGGLTVGTAHAVIRPDQRCFLVFGDCRDDAYGPLVAAAATELDRDLHTIVDESDEPLLSVLADLGFTVQRHEHHYRIATDPARYGLTRVAPPPGVDIISAADADLDRLRALDDTLRQDIPGSAGWRWDPDGFRDETLGPDFDPATYLVAVDRRTGSYVGLVRVWMRPTSHRLGCLAVLPAFRRTRITPALVAPVAHTLHDRGVHEVVTEISADNRAANALLARRSATRTGGSYELIRLWGG